MSLRDNKANNDAAERAQRAAKPYWSPEPAHHVAVNISGQLSDIQHKLELIMRKLQIYDIQKNGD